ncbi:hypothetical protein F5X68DRAFT_223470 [Plectosphaerella plurivora]|uniref:Fatty acid hydroxylase domain-containing protein n=1 Tax=Plectosphaerella plurivora TaxID=936078 RepID=A0A9P8V5U6_9PEZI|nr:hypothetical protein F5X68DRAFT_223470 [Plectosphaerella plurivora]
MGLKPPNRDSLKSTWPTDKSQWTLNHRIIHLFNAYPLPPGTQPPVFAKTDPVPYLIEWRNHVWVLFHASTPLLVHQLILTLGRIQSLPLAAVVLLYSFAFNWTVVGQIRAAARLGLEIGYLDGDVHARDGVPDVGVDQVVASLWKMTGSRMVAAVLLSYDGTAPAASLLDMKWLAKLWVQIGVYGIVLDFWFYIYHRGMHDIPALWKFHRTHHLTKHPNMLLTAYADHAQEFVDMVCIPLATWYTFRAAGWWVCQQYVTFTEVLGHSGLRAYGTPPSTMTWLLRMMGMELLVEDHDLHHRVGWRKMGGNYGKQTRRVECGEGNVDWGRGVYYELWTSTFLCHLFDDLG